MHLALKLANRKLKRIIEAKQDWGTVEQNAYERMLEGSVKNISGKEFLDWLSELEQGQDV
jgi:hypothetical protein